MNTPEAPPGLRTPSFFLPQLESLRGWAILLVVAFHYFGILRSNAPPGGLPADADLWMRLLGAGNTGVTLFFVLSGFLLTLPFIRAVHNKQRISIRRFYSARLLRIIPLYYIVVLVAWLSTSDSSASALKALLFIPVGFEIFPFSVPWWSLCVEVQFYLLLPLMMTMFHHPKGRWLALIALGAWLTLHGTHLLQPQWLGLPNWVNSSILDRGFAFLIGALAGWLYISPAYSRLFNSAKTNGLIALTLLAAQLWLLQWYGLQGSKAALHVMPLFHDLEALLWAGLLLCSLASLPQFSRIFINPVFSHFGTISYSLYLVHVPVQFYLIYPVLMKAKESSASFDLQFVAAVLGSFLLSWLLAVLCYQLIEKPFLKLKSHLPVIMNKYRAAPAKA